MQEIPAQLIASSDKAKGCLGWKPQYDDFLLHTDYLENACKWHQTHRNGYSESQDVDARQLPKLAAL